MISIHAIKKIGHTERTMDKMTHAESSRGSQSKYLHSFSISPPSQTTLYKIVVPLIYLKLFTAISGVTFV